MEVTEYTVPMQMIEGNQKDITLQAVQYLGLKYRRQGDQLTVSCPFHKDTRPSMGIQLSTGRYHCFSCNRGGHIAGMFKELTGQSMYKALGLKEKLPAMSEEEQLNLLATDGMLVKRPILVGDGFVLVGFRQAEWEEALQ